MKHTIIAVDFDGTLVDHRYPDIGREVPYAFDYLKKFEEAGAKLILYTMRSNEYLDQAVEFCRKQGIKFWGINKNPEQHTWTNSPKVYAQRYIDDAAAGVPLLHPAWAKRPFVDWKKVGPEVLMYIKHGATVSLDK